MSSSQEKTLCLFTRNAVIGFEFKTPGLWVTKTTFSEVSVLLWCYAISNYS